MLEQIRRALDDIAHGYRDTRVHHCQLTAATLDGNCCRLAGAALDEATRAAVLAELAVPFPELTFDTRDLRVLRPGQPLAVATNLTSLHAGPSFSTEMVSQLLNGCCVELLQQQDRWAFVCQTDGYLGWTYRAYLSQESAPDPTHVVCTPISPLYEAPRRDAPPIGRVVVGTAVHVAEILDHAIDALGPTWARLALAGSSKGWVPLTDLRALDSLPLDAATQRRQMVHDAARLTGVPYLWGGCSAMGIDCSGLVQLLHSLVGITIPRDADMQYDAGRPVEAPFQPGDLLFFGSQGARRAISHVGMSVGGWRIVHASRARNGVYQDDVQAVEHLRDSFVGACAFVGV
jgi:cell wall-associated NlpC family hydrolase